MTAAALDGARRALKSLRDHPVSLELAYREDEPPTVVKAAGRLEVIGRGRAVCVLRVGDVTFVLRAEDVTGLDYAHAGPRLVVHAGPVQIVIESLHASG
jgi:hypothetical protein